MSIKVIILLQEEEWLIRDCLRHVKGKLSEPAIKPSIVTRCLAFSIFSELLGHRADFAYIHAVKLAQNGSLTEKKMGNAEGSCTPGVFNPQAACDPRASFVRPGKGIHKI